MVESLKVSDVMHDLTQQLSDTGKVATVFGEPREVKGQVIIPAAKVKGGAGSGGGGQTEKDEHGEGVGAGVGVDVRPLGWLIVSDQNTRWQPAVDTTRIITLGALVGVVALLTVRSIIKSTMHARGRKAA